MTPSPPASAWLSRAGNGFQMSRRRKSTKAVINTGMVRGSSRTASSIPATSSITIRPGSLIPSVRSTRDPAQRPRIVTTTSVHRSAGRLNGMSQRAMRVMKLPTVPGTAGEYPAPATLATMKARRSASPRLLLPDQLVAVHLDEGDLGEASWSEAPIPQQHNAVDLGRLTGEPALERKGLIGARAIHEDGLHGPAEGLLPRPGEAILGLLNERRALGHHRLRHLVGHRRSR